MCWRKIKIDFVLIITGNEWTYTDIHGLARTVTDKEDGMKEKKRRGKKFQKKEKKIDSCP